MESINEKMIKLREEIFNTNLESRTEENTSINNILGLKNVDDGLKEALILLTNNYTAELQAIRHHHVKSLMSLIDNDMAVLSKYKELLIKLDGLEADKKEPLLTFNNILKAVGVFMAVILFMTVLYHYEPTAVDKTISFIKDISGMGISFLKNIL